MRLKHILILFLALAITLPSLILAVNAQDNIDDIRISDTACAFANSTSQNSETIPTLPKLPIHSASNGDDTGVPLALLFLFISSIFFYPFLHIIYKSTQSDTKPSFTPLPEKQSHLNPSTEQSHNAIPNLKTNISPPLPAQTFTEPDPNVDFRIVLLPETQVSVHNRCRDTCRYLWYETLMLRNSTKPVISSDACVYLWTSLFYVAVKTLRNQSSVDRIYSYFAEVTAEFVTENQYTDLVIAKVRDTYRSLRQPLNDSCIDPRSGNGRLALWNFLISSNPELLLHSDLRKSFLAATERVWKMIGDVFPQSHPYPKSGEVQYSLDDFPKD